MSNIKMNEQYGKKWFVFYARVRPVLACIAALQTIASFLQYADYYMSKFYALLFFASSIAQAVLAILVMKKSFGDYVEFVRFVKGVLLFEVFHIAYQQSVLPLIEYEDWISSIIVFSVVGGLAYLLWYRLNVKYFAKRIKTVLINEEESENK